MTHSFDSSDYKVAALLPEITRDVYLELPEDVCKEIEVVDGWMVRCERPTPSHQAIQVNFIIGLREAVKRSDTRDRTCHRVSGDIDMLISDGPKFHFRSPDVVVYRWLAEDRGRWADRPYASDCVLVIERLLLTLDGYYICEELRVRRRDFHAIDTATPFTLKLTWEQLDDGL